MIMANGLTDDQPPHGPVPEEPDEADRGTEQSTEDEIASEDEESEDEES
jgi:hypothetical protein